MDNDAVIKALDRVIQIEGLTKPNPIEDSIEKIKSLSVGEKDVIASICDLGLDNVKKTLAKIQGMSEYEVSIVGEYINKKSYFVGMRNYVTGDDIRRMAEIRHVELIPFICAQTSFSKFGTRLILVARQWGHKTDKLDPEYFYKVSTTAQRAVLAGYPPYFLKIDPYRCKISGHDWKRLINKESTLALYIGAEFSKDINNQEFVKKLKR